MHRSGLYKFDDGVHWCARKGYEMEDKNFGKRLTLLRAKLGLKQHEVALKIGASYRGYQRWEGGYVPSKKNIQKLIHFYGCTEDFLLKGEGPVVPPVKGQLVASPTLTDLAVQECLSLMFQRIPPPRWYHDAPPEQFSKIQDIIGSFGEAIRNSGFMIDKNIWAFIGHLFYNYIQEDKSGSELFLE